mmetsp:Transcript_66322/g.158673  ORF Transcript_66322/g.158673 Transcript_66322/m.158673 type:complete len:209 (-) Transcript_66322:619-1245(-)
MPWAIAAKSRTLVSARLVIPKLIWTKMRSPRHRMRLEFSTPLLMLASTTSAMLSIGSKACPLGHSAEPALSFPSTFQRAIAATSGLLRVSERSVSMTTKRPVATATKTWAARSATTARSAKMLALSSPRGLCSARSSRAADLSSSSSSSLVEFEGALCRICASGLLGSLYKIPPMYEWNPLCSNKFLSICLCSKTWKTSGKSFFLHAA